MTKKRSRLARWLRRLVLAVIALAVVGMVVTAMLPQPVGVDLAVVEHGPLAVTVDEDGRTRIKERYIVSTPLSGRLLSATGGVAEDSGCGLIDGVTPRRRSAASGNR